MKDESLDRDLHVQPRDCLVRDRVSEIMSGKSSSSSSVPAFNGFEDFWQHYVTQHQHPVNQLMHVVGTIGGLVCLGLAIYSSWMWLLILPSVGYGLTWIGHFAIERNRPLTFSYPLWSLRADYRLVARLLLRRPLTKPTIALYQGEVEKSDGAIRRQDHADDLHQPAGSRVLSGEHRSTSSRTR